MGCNASTRGVLAAAIVLVSAASSREALADPDPAAEELQLELVSTPSGARWYIELVGDACQSERPAFEREVTLACGAVGGTCRVVASPSEAELRAIIDCSGPAETWTLSTATVEGATLATLDLAGPTDDRLREAAIEVARDVAPERTLVVEALRTALPDERPVDVPTATENFTLILGGRATTTDSRKQAVTGGVHLLAGMAFGKHARGTLGMVGELGGREDKATRTFRAGPGIAIGAPFDPKSLVGVAAEVGVASTNKYVPSSDQDGTLSPVTSFAAYGQTTLTVQWPHGSLRPYAAVSAAIMSEGTASLYASAEGGLAFALR